MKFYFIDLRKNGSTVFFLTPALLTDVGVIGIAFGFWALILTIE